MSKFLEALGVTALLVAMTGASAQAAGGYPGVGRDATPQEVAAWDIDVRPDFKGLPAGSGTVAQGQDIWEAKCAQCHGFFGESGEVFSPLAGGITQEDIKTGRVANLTSTTFPGRTTFMKVATLSTIWDYINRAMPWTAPKSLSTSEVYAVTAFLLNLNGIVPDKFTLSDTNIREVQQRMPNRNGMTTEHALWPGKEFPRVNKPDTKNVACMKDCNPAVKVTSLLPDFARNAHGNLAEQNRLVGAQHGANTTLPERKTGDAGPAPVALAATAPQAKPTESKSVASSNAGSKTALALLGKYNCTVCHGLDNKIVGPAYSDVAKKYTGKADYLAKKIKSGSTGVWGPIPMPPQRLSDTEAMQIAVWLANGAAK